MQVLSMVRDFSWAQTNCVPDWNTWSPRFFDDETAGCGRVPNTSAGYAKAGGKEDVRSVELGTLIMMLVHRVVDERFGLNDRPRGQKSVQPPGTRA